METAPHAFLEETDIVTDTATVHRVNRHDNEQYRGAQSVYVEDRGPSPFEMMVMWVLRADHTDAVHLDLDRYPIKEGDLAFQYLARLNVLFPSLKKPKCPESCHPQQIDYWLEITHIAQGFTNTLWMYPAHDEYDSIFRGLAFKYPQMVPDDRGDPNHTIYDNDLVCIVFTRILLEFCRKRWEDEPWASITGILPMVIYDPLESHIRLIVVRVFRPNGNQDDDILAFLDFYDSTNTNKRMDTAIMDYFAGHFLPIFGDRATIRRVDLTRNKFGSMQSFDYGTGKCLSYSHLLTLLLAVMPTKYAPVEIDESLIRTFLRILDARTAKKRYSIGLPWINVKLTFKRLRRGMEELVLIFELSMAKRIFDRSGVNPTCCKDIESDNDPHWTDLPWIHYND